MAKSTELTKGLSRLLKLCPELTLDPRSIQLIIDGKQNQVIAEYRGNEYIEDEVVKEIVMGTAIEEPVTESINEIDATGSQTVDTNSYTETNTDKSFNEYFD